MILGMIVRVGNDGGGWFVRVLVWIGVKMWDGGGVSVEWELGGGWGWG